jgi:hypothetical protein
MASNQGWNEERIQTRKRGGGMHQLKEVDMMSANEEARRSSHRKARSHASVEALGI